MTEAEVFILADEALNEVVQRIRDDQWGMKLPDWFQLGGSQDRDSLSLRTIINYHAYDEAWVPDVLAGKTKEESTNSPQTMDEDLLGDDPKASFQAIVDKALTAVRALRPEDMARTAHLSYGDFPVSQYLKHITSFRGFRAYDLAKLIGVSTKLPDDLVQGMWDEFAPEVEQWRAMGVFGPPVAVAADASLQDRLLGLVGRDPSA